MIIEGWILKAHLPQKAPSFIDSSLLSPHSLWELHISDLSIHFPLLHWNRPIFSHVPGFPEIERHKLIIPNSTKECRHTFFLTKFLLILTYFWQKTFNLLFMKFLINTIMTKKKQTKNNDNNNNNDYNNNNNNNNNKWDLKILCFLFQFSRK